MTFDPTKPVRTRDGREARIICTDVNNTYFPIVGVIRNSDGKEEAFVFRKDGTISIGIHNDCLDLVNVPERVERWANVYGHEQLGKLVSQKTRQEASRVKGNNCSGTVKFTFEDEKLVEVTLEKE